MDNCINLSLNERYNVNRNIYQLMTVIFIGSRTRPKIGTESGGCQKSLTPTLTFLTGYVLGHGYCVKFRRLLSKIITKKNSVALNESTKQFMNIIDLN